MSSSVKNSGIIVINDFLNNSECNILIDHIENLEKGWKHSNDLRKMSFNPESEQIKKIVIKCLNKAKEVFKYDTLYVAEYLLSFYSTGYNMEVHSDLEDEKEHFEVSIVTYLNNDFSGGDIFFPLLDLRYKPKKGDIVLFLSKPNNNIHGVEKITSGKRYVMPIWTTTLKQFKLNYIHQNEKE